MEGGNVHQGSSDGKDSRWTLHLAADALGGYPASERQGPESHICFVWRGDNAYDVEIVDYHSPRGKKMTRKVLPPIHPGEIPLEEFLLPLSVSQYRLAKDICVPARRINEIVHIRCLQNQGKSNSSFSPGRVGNRTDETTRAFDITSCAAGVLRNSGKERDRG